MVSPSLSDIKNLLDRGILIKAASGGRSTNYVLKSSN